MRADGVIVPPPAFDDHSCLLEAVEDLPVDHVCRPQPSTDSDRQALARELVDHIEPAELSPLMGAVLDEVVGPHVVRMLRAQPDARAVRQPEPAALRLPRRHFEPLPPPDPLDPLGVHQPAGRAQQGCDAPIAVATITGG